MARSVRRGTIADYRPSVGIMLLNDRSEVFVARRIDVPGDTWQMPQGGIGEGEDPRAAAFRELREEIGTDKAKLMAESRTWLRYDLPKDLIPQSWEGRWHGQRQKWFVMRFSGKDADINLETEHPEFAAWKWVSIDELPAIVISFKRQVYLDLLAEFRELTQTLDQRIAELLEEPIIRMRMAADSIDEKHLYELLRRVARDLRK